MAFRFIDLPLELRNNIYEELLLIDENHKRTYPQILATSKKIRHEATAILNGAPNKLIISLNIASSDLTGRPLPRTMCKDFTEVVVGNRKPFVALSPADTPKTTSGWKLEHYADGFIQSLRWWPRSLGKVEFVELIIESGLPLPSIRQQLLVFSWLLAGNSKVSVKLTMDTFDEQALLPLNELRPGAMNGIWIRQKPGVDHTRKFKGLAFRQSTKNVYSRFAVMAATQELIEEFRILQIQAGMTFRGERRFRGLMKTAWVYLNTMVLIPPYYVYSRATGEAATDLQVRDILGSEWVAKTKLEARKKIAAMASLTAAMSHLHL